MSDLKNEYKSFMEDIEKNIENPKDLEYIKERASDLFTNILQKLDEIINYKEEKIDSMMKRQEELEKKFDKVQGIISNIENDIYAEDGFDFEIICPYCDNEFVIDEDDNRTEIECPECKNIIELDWSDNFDDEEECSGHCSHCHGCSDEEDEDM